MSLLLLLNPKQFDMGPYIEAAYRGAKPRKKKADLSEEIDQKLGEYVEVLANLSDLSAQKLKDEQTAALELELQQARVKIAREIVMMEEEEEALMLLLID